MAFGFAYMWGGGCAMTTQVEADGPPEELLFELHITVGVTLVAVPVVRTAVQMFCPSPPVPCGLQPWERTGARLAHAVL